MKTNLNRTIENEEEAKAFLQDLIDNNEAYHPDEDAQDIIFQEAEVTQKEAHRLNVLMGQVFEVEGFDPYGYLIDNGAFV